MSLVSAIVDNTAIDNESMLKKTYPKMYQNWNKIFQNKLKTLRKSCNMKEQHKSNLE